MEGIRPAIDADADGIAAVHRLSRAVYYGVVPDPKDERATMWAQLLTEEARLTWVAEDDDEVGVLEVWAGNQRAIDFYRRRGWRRTATERPGPQDRPFVTYELAAAS